MVAATTDTDTTWDVASLQGTVALPLLADPDAYSPSTFDWFTGHVPFGAWVEIFRTSIKGFREKAERDPSMPQDQAKEAAARFASCYGAVCDAVQDDPRGYAAQAVAARHVEPMRLTALRELCLRRQGFADVFKPVKAEEDAAALQLLPAVLREIDEAPDAAARCSLLLRGVFAGNIFDLGAAASADLYASGQASFHDSRERLLPRPWVVDDFDAAVSALAGGKTYKRVLMLVDNAGSDVILGMLPLARELLRAAPGARVTLGANSGPSINDITAQELSGLLQQMADEDVDGPLGEAWREGRLHVVGNGCALPVIDLRYVSAELAEAAADADLLVLEGMGRSIETNLRASFTCDSLKLGMVKHPEVATSLGGRLYDCVCKYDAVRGNMAASVTEN